jgi:hypothetical protein
MIDHRMEKETNSIRNILNFQFGISWKLLEIHLADLQDEEYLWRPASKGLHIFNESGVCQADWPESESYDIGPASIAWLTWHVTFWWSMVLDYSFGNATLTHKDVKCFGSMKETRDKIYHLRDEWVVRIDKLSVDDLFSSERTKWPFTNKPFHELCAWLNIELMKNAAEIGYCRFLYATQRK